MRIGMLVNDIMTEKPIYTTQDLALKAVRMGHTVYMMGIQDLSYLPDGFVGATARLVPEKKFKSRETMLRQIQSEETVEQITSEDMDVLLLRNDPADDLETRPWAASAGIIFGQAAVKDGLLVLNDPNSLANAINKMYFEHFPQEVRPRTIITCEKEKIEEFFEELNDHMVLKPLQGSGGKNVFFVKKDEAHNLGSIIEAISDSGYVVAQEYLPAATEGDIRVFVMNGHLIEKDGKHALLRRHNEQDFRSNMSAGGQAKEAKVTEEIRRIVDVVRPKLIQDGMFLVGLDIVGDKLMEVNVFSPGALPESNEMTGVDFTPEVIKAIEKKLQYKNSYDYSLPNHILATM